MTEHMVTDLIHSMYAYWKKSDGGAMTTDALCCCNTRWTSSMPHAAALDEKRFDDWPDFSPTTRAIGCRPAENFDRKLPLALMALESRV